MSFRRSLPACLPFFTLLAVTCTVSPEAGAKAKKPSAGGHVVGMVTEGIAERLHTPKTKKGKKKSSEVGKTFTAVCDGTVASWKVSDLGDDGAWVGGFAGGNKPKHCILLDPSADAAAAKGRPNANTAQIAAARTAAVAALTPKSGEAPSKVELTVWNDGEGFVAVAQTTKANTGKGSCLDHTSLVVLAENDGAWKPVFRPGGKGKDVCGYSFFTRGDIDGDGRDEIALRVDKGDGYGYRVLKRSKATYNVVAK